jgi:hypothetical protein
MPDDPREPYGRLVNDTRRAFAAEQVEVDSEGRRRQFHVAEWDDRAPSQRELDCRISSVIAEIVRAEVRGRFGYALREHYLMNVICDPERKMDNPVCGCSRVFLGWHPSIGEAREAWISHVMDVVSGDE